MSRILRFKKFIIAALIVLAFVATIVAFSVSYAKWVAPAEITVNGTVGKWTLEPATLVLDDGAEYALDKYEDKNGIVYTTSFLVEDNSQKKFNIMSGKTSLSFKLGTVDKVSNKGCDPVTGEDFKFKTKGYTKNSVTTYDGTYFVFISGDTMAVLFVRKDTSGDFSAGFAEVVNAPHTMEIFLGPNYAEGTNYYGIVTSNGDRVKIYTDTKKSDLFTLKEGDLFAILINSRVQGRNAGVVVPDGITKLEGGAQDHIFTINKAGTYYISAYTDNKNVTISRVGSIDFTAPEPVAPSVNFIQIKDKDSFFASFEITDADIEAQSATAETAYKEFGITFDYKSLGNVTVGTGVETTATGYKATGKGIYIAVVDNSGDATIERITELARVTFKANGGSTREPVVIGNRYSKEINLTAGESFTVSLCDGTITPDIAAVIAKDITVEGTTCTVQKSGKYSFAVEVSVNGLSLRIREVKEGEQPPVAETRELKFLNANGIVASTVDLSSGSITFTVDSDSGDKNFKVYVDGVEITTATGLTYDATKGFTAYEYGTYTVTLSADNKLTVSAALDRKYVSGSETVDLAAGNATFTLAEGASKSFRIYYGRNEITATANDVAYSAANGYTADKAGDYTISLDASGKLTVEFKAASSGTTPAGTVTISFVSTYDDYYTKMSSYVEFASYASKGVTESYNGKDYTTATYFNSNAVMTIKAQPTAYTAILHFTADAAGGSIDVNNTVYSVQSDYKVTLDLAANTSYNIKKKSGTKLYCFLVELVSETATTITTDTISFGSVTAGTISDNTTITGSWANLSNVAILANSNKTVTVNAQTGITADGLAYDGYLNTGGGGSSTERSISLTLKEGYDYKITVYARSSGTTNDGRYVQCIGATTEIASEVVDVSSGAINGFEFEVKNATGGATCQICSKSSGINIYLIVVEPKV